MSMLLMSIIESILIDQSNMILTFHTWSKQFRTKIFYSIPSENLENNQIDLISYVIFVDDDRRSLS